MIDVIFLLIVFFVAVSQIVDRDAVQLELPVINDSAASEISSEDKVIVNLIGNVDGQVSASSDVLTHFITASGGIT